MDVALIEDDQQLKEALEIYLRMNGYHVESFKLLESFYTRSYEKFFEVIIADINLPDGTFLQFLNENPHLKKYSKILIISSDSEIASIKKSFLLGAEDYIKKPFDYEELDLRIKKIFQAFDLENLCDETVFDKRDEVIRYREETIHLVPKEAEFLKILMANRGHFVSTIHLISWLWGDEATTNTLAAMVKRLRKKLPNPEIIVSKRELGYALKCH